MWLAGIDWGDREPNGEPMRSGKPIGEPPQNETPVRRDLRSAQPTLTGANQ